MSRGECRTTHERVVNFVDSSMDGLSLNSRDLAGTLRGLTLSSASLSESSRVGSLTRISRFSPSQPDTELSQLLPDICRGRHTQSTGRASRWILGLEHTAYSITARFWTHDEVLPRFFASVGDCGLFRVVEHTTST